MSPIWILVALLAAVALLSLGASAGAMRRRAFGRGGMGLIFGLLLLALAGATGTAAWTLTRFQALTRETTAATIRLEPLGEQRFRATIDTGETPARTFELSGDQVWVDAQIVKWHPYANALGLHTAYRLDRIGGRYRSLDDERTAPRTVESLSDADAAENLFAWAERQPWLRPLVDAQYGSGTFVSAAEPASLQVRVSASGLLIRESPGLDGP